MYKDAPQIYFIEINSTTEKPYRGWYLLTTWGRRQIVFDIIRCGPKVVKQFNICQSTPASKEKVYGLNYFRRLLKKMTIERTLQGEAIKKQLKCT
jgi:hypothetical protein